MAAPQSDFTMAFLRHQLAIERIDAFISFSSFVFMPISQRWAAL
jgi:hypothetical protein